MNVLQPVRSFHEPSLAILALAHGEMAKDVFPLSRSTTIAVVNLGQCTRSDGLWIRGNG